MPGDGGHMRTMRLLPFAAAAGEVRLTGLGRPKGFWDKPNPTPSRILELCSAWSGEAFTLLLEFQPSFLRQDSDFFLAPL